MDREAHEAKSEKPRIVLPGDRLADSGSVRPGNGVYTDSGGLYSGRFGILHRKGDRINIKPFVDVYRPSPGDKVIGKVVDLGLDHWMLDINASTTYGLHVRDTPWKVGFGHVGSYLDVGDVVIARVKRRAGSSKLVLSMQGAALKKLGVGYLAWINVSKIPILVGRDMETIGEIRRRTRCRIIIGHNGVIWIEGSPSGIARVVRIIDTIEDLPQTALAEGSIHRILDVGEG